MGMAEADKIIDAFLDQRPVELQLWENVVKFYGQANRPERIESLLRRLSQRESKNAAVWYQLAAIQAQLLDGSQACVSLQNAIKLDQAKIQEARNDARLDRKSTRLNSSHGTLSRMPSSA